MAGKLPFFTLLSWERAAVAKPSPDCFWFSVNCLESSSKACRLVSLKPSVSALSDVPSFSLLLSAYSLHLMFVWVVKDAGVSVNPSKVSTLLAHLCYLSSFMFFFFPFVKQCWDSSKQPTKTEQKSLVKPCVILLWQIFLNYHGNARVVQLFEWLCRTFEVHHFFGYF